MKTYESTQHCGKGKNRQNEKTVYQNVVLTYNV